MTSKTIYKITQFSTIIFASAFLANALADTQFYNLHTGFYVSGNAGVAFNKNSTSGFAGNFFVGRQFNPNIAIEGGYGYYGTLGGTSVLNVAAKGTLPLGKRVTLFGKLGGAYIELENCFFGCATYSQVAPAFGLGMGVGINQDWTGSLEYNGVYSTLTNNNGFIGGVTLGVTRYFDA
ncbi:MAG TPA: outer membrane beta-barrel protein [Coxiellaceae bacterium]|nr:MAG: hypothetical protein A3E81_04800 [Gammaproteobacteria bacterium RIFCSPHIGHO2_12_FULL_36_30]HLB55924.1 outer membrane beta-barrel protein [Coxiellaceae bacterium]